MNAGPRPSQSRSGDRGNHVLPAHAPSGGAAQRCPRAQGRSRAHHDHRRPRGPPPARPGRTRPLQPRSGMDAMASESTAEQRPSRGVDGTCRPDVPRPLPWPAPPGRPDGRHPRARGDDPAPGPRLAAAPDPAGGRREAFPVRFLLQAAVAAALLAGLAGLVDWSGVLAALRRTAPAPLLAAFAVCVLGVVISAAKWRLLLRRAGVALPLPEAARLYWVGMFFSNFLPTSVGGDAVRLALTPPPDRQAQVAGSILVERLTGFIVMLALCALGLALRPPGPARGLPWLLPIVLLGLAVLASALLLAPAPLVRLLTWLDPRVPAAARWPLAAARKVAAATAAHARDMRALVPALLMSLPFYGTIILAQWLVLRAVGAGPRLGEVALAAPLVQLLGLVPLTPNGLGVVEAGFVLLYAGLGVPADAATAAAVLRRLVDLANSPIGAPAWLRLGRKAAGPLFRPREM